MDLILTLLTTSGFFYPLQGLAGWLAWLLLAGAEIGVWAWLHTRLGDSAAAGARSKLSARLRWGLWGGLLLAAPLAYLFLALRIPLPEALSLPGQPLEAQAPLLLVLGPLPWLLAAGLLSPFGTATVALAGGLALGWWGSHNLFTPLEVLALALLCSAAFQQNYRSAVFSLLRQPLFTALILGLVYPLFSIYSNTALVDGPLATRLDYALTHTVSSLLAVGLPLLLAGLVASLIKWMAPDWFGSQLPLQSPPNERSLLFRILSSLAPLAMALVATLIISNWVIAGSAARQMLKQRMSGAAQLASTTLPSFFESGQNLLQATAQDERWPEAGRQEQIEMLSHARLSLPFFDELFLVQLQRDGAAAARLTLAAVPEADFNANTTAMEIAGIELATDIKIPIQKYTLPPNENSPARLSFIAPVKNPDGSVYAVLVGRTILETNPMLRPVLENLSGLDDLGGQGLLVDQEGLIVYRSGSDPQAEEASLSEPETFSGQLSADPNDYEAQGPDGIRRLYSTYPAQGYPWTVVISLPARQAQQQALNLATPMLIMILTIFALGGLLISLGLRLVTQSLESLAQNANRIAGGDLGQPLEISGTEPQEGDEVAQLRYAFEQMRLSLKARLDELKRLLVVSQSVAASLEMEEVVRSVLESALNTTGASSARLVLVEHLLPAIEANTPHPTHYGLAAGGQNSQRYAALDEQVLALTRQQDKVILNNLSRARQINLSPLPANARPEALLALPLKDGQNFYGALWLAFDKAHQFSEDETRFIATLAGQTALATTNVSLFLNAEIGRQQLAGVLASTSDPVLVTDQQEHLLLANPAAWQVLGLPDAAANGGGTDKSIDVLIRQRELNALLRAGLSDRRSAEVLGNDQRIYLATASSLMAGGRQIGRVCVMRDVTHFKELDALKSEFVSTVSHDLRSPLTLMRGYATMLEMVGDLNEQQGNYVKKIVSGVDTMSHLVNNLLDLGRIEAGLDLQLELVDLHAVVERILSALQLHAGQKQIQVKSQLAPGLPMLEADPGLLQQAMHNLIENAIKYTDPNGTVTVQARQQGEFMVFSVTDSGIGIAPVDQERLFEKFYRAPSRDARKRHGTGLGLAIVKSIAERHQGRAWLESQLGKGSTFYIELPLRQPAKPAKNQKLPLD